MNAAARAPTLPSTATPENIVPHPTRRRFRKPRPDESTPAGQHADGTPQPAQPSADEQSGSTGRRVADGNQPPGQDTGQDRYGQSGYGGAKDRER